MLLALPQDFQGKSFQVAKGETKSIAELGEDMYQTISIEGKLNCENAENQVIHADHIVVKNGGTFNCTIPDESKKIRFELTGANKEILVESGGTLEFHGSQRTSWVRLLITADAGTDTIQFESNDWHEGDELAIAPTDYEIEEYEVVKIAERLANDGSILRLSEPLKFKHFAAFQSFNAKLLDSRAEVALLTRNIQIYGDESSLETKNGATIKIRGEGANGYFENIEMRFVGKYETLGQYPIHWHNVGDATGQYAKRVSVHKSFFRCITIHCTNDVLLSENTCVDHFGHGYFLEDGAEHGNILESNLGMISRRAGGSLVESDLSSKDEILPDTWGVSTFWFINPDNSFVNNVAVGSEHTGFSLELTDETERRRGETLTSTKTCDIPDFEYLRQIPVSKFEGNVAHAMGANAFQFGTMYYPSSVSTISNLQAYKIKGNGGFGACLWSHCLNMTVENFICADFQRAAWIIQTMTLQDVVFVGTTFNNGTKPPFNSLIGMNFYDGPAYLRNVHFENFVGFEKTGAFELIGGIDTSTKYVIESLTFKNPDFATFAGTEPGRPSAVQIVDRDGGITGMKNGQIMTRGKDEYSDIVRDDGSCKPSPDNKALYCPPSSSSGRVAMIQFVPSPPTSDLVITLPSGKSRQLETGGKTGFEYNLLPNLKYAYRLSLSNSAEPWPECFSFGISSTYLGNVFELVFSQGSGHGIQGQELEARSMAEFQQTKASGQHAAVYYKDSGSGDLYIALRAVTPNYNMFPDFPWQEDEVKFGSTLVHTLCKTV